MKTVYDLMRHHPALEVICENCLRRAVLNNRFLKRGIATHGEREGRGGRASYVAGLALSPASGSPEKVLIATIYQIRATLRLK